MYRSIQDNPTMSDTWDHMLDFTTGYEQEQTLNVRSSTCLVELG